MQSIGEVCGHQQEVLVHLTTPLEIPPLAPNEKSRVCPAGAGPQQTRKTRHYKFQFAPSATRLIVPGKLSRYNKREEHSCPTTPKNTLAPASTPNCPRSRPGPINFPATLLPRAFPSTPPSARKPVSPTSAPSPSNTCRRKIASS